MLLFYVRIDAFDQFESPSGFNQGMAPDSLSLVNDQAIPVGIAKRRPMANFRFSRSEEEGDIVFAQVSDSAFEVVDFKCN
jgi:hypothetical protein